jgi:metallophosphoesterase (TIGR00282 family)
MKILCIGDVVGSPGRKAIHELLPDLIEQHQLDFVLANAENSAGGSGITAETVKDLLSLPIDVLTGGNHTWRFKEATKLLDSEGRLLRPLNYPPKTPGKGFAVYQAKNGINVGVLNLQGRVFMDPLPSPFAAADEAIAVLKQECQIVLVDMHAEATSEKRALGWYLDGQVSAVFGTHTHVATADEEILPNKTAYITDIGMTGPYDSVIGMRKDLVLQRFLTMRPTAFNVAKHDVRLCGIVVDVDPETGHANRIERVRKALPV